MKKGWKIYWIVCGISIAIGFMCCAVAFGLGFTAEMLSVHVPENVGVFSRDSADGLDIEEVGIYRGIRELDVELIAGEVNIYTSVDDGIMVYTEGIHSNEKFRCKAEGDELKITAGNNKTIFGKTSVGVVEIYIPQTANLREVSIDVGAGELYVEEILADELSINVGAGEAVVDGFDAGKIDIDCGVGEIEMVTDADERDYNYNIDCGIGEVNCGSHKMEGIGGKRTINNDAEKEMNIDCGIGEVTISFRNAEFFSKNSVPN